MYAVWSIHDTDDSTYKVLGTFFLNKHTGNNSKPCLSLQADS